MVIPKIKGYSFLYQLNLNLITTPYEICFWVSNGIMSWIKNVIFIQTYRCHASQLLDVAKNNKPLNNHQLTTNTFLSHQTIQLTVSTNKSGLQVPPCPTHITLNPLLIVIHAAIHQSTPWALSLTFISTFLRFIDIQTWDNVLKDLYTEASLCKHFLTLLLLPPLSCIRSYLPLQGFFSRFFPSL